MSAQFTGKNFIQLERISSTNSYIQELLSKSTPLAHGSVILADEQSHGRGQQNSFWEAEPHKNLTFSILYHIQNIKADQQFLLSMAVSIAICDFLDDIAEKDLLIKWPNDIYYKEKKIAGILIENTLQADKIKHTIIGIGLNINQTEFKSNAPNPISLKQITELQYSLEIILPKLLSYIEYYYLLAEQQRFSYLEERYLNKLLYIGQLKKFKTSEGMIEGRIRGIDAYGRLKIEVNEEVRLFAHKEIEFLL